MPDNNMMIMLGLGAAALWFLNRGGSEEDQVGQLAGAAMKASGEGTAPDSPFVPFSAPANPVFFFNQGGQMAKVPGTPVPVKSSSDEDIGIYPGGFPTPELIFNVAPGPIPVGTMDMSPSNPAFSSPAPIEVTPATIWDEQVEIAEANLMPLLAIGDRDGTGINILGANVDIATLSSKEQFRATNLAAPGAITSGFTAQSATVLSEYVKGFIPATGPEASRASNIYNEPKTVISPTFGQGMFIEDTELGGLF